MKKLTSSLVIICLLFTITKAQSQIHYAELSKKLDGGYYLTDKSSGTNYFYFKFNEEYYDGSNSNLRYEVFQDNGAKLTSLPILTEQIGDNRFSLNVNSLTIGNYYKIYVYNRKNEVWKARFKIN